MKPIKSTLVVLAALAGAVALAGCVMPYHEENAALRMATPAAQSRALANYAGPNNDYPTVGGDILKNQNANFQTAPNQPTH